MNIWKVIAATLVIFGAGLIVGGLFVHRSADLKPAAPETANVQVSNPWQMRNLNLLRRMDRDLALTPQQHEQIEKIIAGSQDRTRDLWKPIAQEMNHETVKVCDEIRDVLTPEQKVKFDALSKNHPDRSGERGFDRPRRRGAGGSGPPSFTNSISTNTP